MGAESHSGRKEILEKETKREEVIWIDLVSLDEDDC